MVISWRESSCAGGVMILDKMQGVSIMISDKDKNN